jgi:hypothetical protein
MADPKDDDKPENNEYAAATNVANSGTPTGAPTPVRTMPPPDEPQPSTNPDASDTFTAGEKPEVDPNAKPAGTQAEKEGTSNLGNTGPNKGRA